MRRPQRPGIDASKSSVACFPAQETRQLQPADGIAVVAAGRVCKNAPRDGKAGVIRNAWRLRRFRYERRRKGIEHGGETPPGGRACRRPAEATSHPDGIEPGEA